MYFNCNASESCELRIGFHIIWFLPKNLDFLAILFAVRIRHIFCIWALKKMSV
uniref:Uncharacterized protein n=1 Tax=Rhizophora mucronata TaxID=61149 RepID=A0A2P2QK84_RHIMU